MKFTELPTLLHYEPCYEKNGFFAYAKTKTQISCAVTAQLISAFVFAIRIVQSLFFLNSKFQASNHLLWLYSPVCVGPGRKPRRPVFSERGSYLLHVSQFLGAKYVYVFVVKQNLFALFVAICGLVHNVENKKNNYHAQIQKIFSKGA